MAKIKLPIYLDYHATTPVDARVLEAMLPYFSEHFGNAASRQHIFGRAAEKAVSGARETVAKVLNAAAEDIIFTSGATEAINLAVKGVARQYVEKGKHIVTCVTEHRAVLDSIRTLEREGFEATYLPVTADGNLDLNVFQKSLRPDTILVALMHANNEIGTMHDIEHIGKITRARGIFFFSDTTQSVGKIPLDVEKCNLDLACLSAHKMYGPKGVGALYVRNRKPRVRLLPQMDGGGHEQGLRSGTLNVPGIVGLGAAIQLCAKSMEEESARLGRLRDRLWVYIQKELDHVDINGSMANRLPNNLNISFAYVENGTLMKDLSGDLAISSGSACASAVMEPSHVIKALGLGEERMHGSLRFGLGRYTTEEEVDYAAARIVDSVRRHRAASPVYQMIKERDAT